MRALNVIRWTRQSFFAAAIAATLAGCASTPKPTDLASTINKKPELSTLNALVKQAGLTETLKGTGPLTVFAPSNEAFQAVPAKTMETLAQNPEQLKSVLNFHVVPGALTSAEVTNRKVKSAQGATLEISKAGDIVTVENAMVTHGDIQATNGVVHIVDTVLIPPAPKK